MRRIAWLAFAVSACALLLGVAPVSSADDAPPGPKVPPSKESPVKEAPAAPPGPPAPAAEKNPAEAKKHSDRGDVLREEAKWQEASHAYGKSLDEDGDQYLVHVRYQETVVRSGHGPELVAEYDKDLKAHPGDLATKLHRLRIDTPASRITALAATLKEGGPNPMVQLELGRALLAANDAAGAKKALESAYAVKPDFADVLELSCEALRLSGDATGARNRLEGRLKQAPESFEILLRLARMDIADGKNKEGFDRAMAVLSMRPSYLAALLLKSEAASRVGQAEDARSALDAALRINPTDPDALVASADLQAKGAKEEALKAAVASYKKVLDVKDGPRLHALVGLGWVYERLGQLKEAAESYREAAGLAPTDASIVNAIGVVLLKQKSFNAALVQFKRAVDLAPKSPEAYCNMATVSEQQSDWAGAIALYEKVLAMKGQENNVRALLNCAFDHEQLTQYKKAEELYVRARQVRPEDSEIATFHGDNLFFQKKFPAAVKAYQDAVKLDAKNRFGWRGLGIALSGDGKAKEAVEALLKARELKADDTGTLIALGDIYYDDLEDSAKALEAYEAYVKAGGTNPDVPTRIQICKDELAK